MRVKNGKVLIGRSFLDVDLDFDRVITAIDPLEGAADFDARGCYVIPGLVDIHTHGAVGEDFSDGKPEGLQPLADYYASRGVTSYLATTMTLKEETLSRLTAQVPGLKRVGEGTAPHILAVTLPGYKSEVIVRFLSDRGICLSSGSACHKGKPSHVYAALKLPKKELDGVLRISFSYDTTLEDVQALAEGLKAAQEQLFTSLS